jgi:hypothetical protein
LANALALIVELQNVGGVFQIQVKHRIVGVRHDAGKFKGIAVLTDT